MKAMLSAIGCGVIVTMPAAAVFSGLIMILIVYQGSSERFVWAEADIVFGAGLLTTCMVLAPVTMVVLPILAQFRVLAGMRLTIFAATAGSYGSALLLLWSNLLFPDPWMLAIPSLCAGFVAGLLYTAIRAGWFTARAADAG